MARYRRSDDGSTIDGKIVVFLDRPAADAAGEDAAIAPGGAAPGAAGQSAAAGAANAAKAERLEAAKSQAATLQAAARTGVPFCEECEKARQKLAQAGPRT